mmetsp:Transcript_89141/g.285759  ORF Transcript_89141/g.285759 Transcript_89141/m.285759 type:complete len:179 (+) Transcript_89141:139-675(+)
MVSVQPASATSSRRGSAMGQAVSMPPQVGRARSASASRHGSSVGGLPSSGAGVPSLVEQLQKQMEAPQTGGRRKSGQMTAQEVLLLSQLAPNSKDPRLLAALAMAEKDGGQQPTKERPWLGRSKTQETRLKKKWAKIAKQYQEDGRCPDLTPVQMSKAAASAGRGCAARQSTLALSAR